MTTETKTTSPERIVGLYSTAAVDWIAEHVVTEAMVDAAILQGTGTPNRRNDLAVRVQLRTPARRATARRNIAIGIRCGSYLLPRSLRVAPVNDALYETVPA